MRRLGGVGGGLARAWLLVVLVPLLWDLRASAAAPQRLAASSLSPLRGTITDVGRADPNRRHSAVVGLVPRNPEALEAFLADVQDPSSPRYRQFLTQAEFNAPDREPAPFHSRSSGRTAVTSARRTSPPSTATGRSSTAAGRRS